MFTTYHLYKLDSCYPSLQQHFLQGSTAFTRTACVWLVPTPDVLVKDINK